MGSPRLGRSVSNLIGHKASQRPALTNSLHIELGEAPPGVGSSVKQTSSLSLCCFICLLYKLVNFSQALVFRQVDLTKISLSLDKWVLLLNTRNLPGNAQIMWS